jgi:hypothetical protein
MKMTYQTYLDLEPSRRPVIPRPTRGIALQVEPLLFSQIVKTADFFRVDVDIFIEVVMRSALSELSVDNTVLLRRILPFQSDSFIA